MSYWVTCTYNDGNAIHKLVIAPIFLGFGVRELGPGKPEWILRATYGPNFERSFPMKDLRGWASAEGRALAARRTPDRAGRVVWLTYVRSDKGFPGDDPPVYNPLVRFRYVNHRGEESERLVRPLFMGFGTTQYYPEAQWMLHGLDVGKEAERTFAMTRVEDWAPAQ